jgi:hypothetical protein
MVNIASIQHTSQVVADWYSSAKRRDGAVVAHALFDASDLQQSIRLQRVVFESIQLEY